MTIPSMERCKVGNIFYSALAWMDDLGKAHIDVDEWHIRTIQHAKRDSIDKRFNIETPITVYLVRKTEFTWVRKTRGKDKTMCWAARIDKYDRKSFAVGHNLPMGLFTTVRQALMAQLQSTKDSIERCDREAKDMGNYVDEREEWKKELEEHLRLLPLIKARITKLKNKK